MKPLFWIGLVILILGIASLVVPNPSHGSGDPDGRWRIARR